MTKTSEVGAHHVRIVVDFAAEPEVVWREWTKPESFSHWFGTPPMETPADLVTLDVRPFGHWSATMVGPDGSHMPFGGAYLEVGKPRRLVFTFQDPEDPDNPDVETATVDLVETSEGTRMTFEQMGSLPSGQYPLLQQGYSTFFERMADDLRTSA